MSDLLTIIDLYQGTNEIATFKYGMSGNNCEDDDCDGWDCDCHYDDDGAESDCGHW